jgi:hypothetical protein
MNVAKKLYVYSNKDLFIFGSVTFGLGMLVGIGIGFQWAWKPVVDCFRPLIG